MFGHSYHGTFGYHGHVCGCYIFNTVTNERTYLPQVKLDVHTTILTTASRTVLRQTFVNNSSNRSLDEIRYAFPLFDGVSVVEFSCQIGERTIYGLVREKQEACKTYEAAKQRGENAALLEQLPDATDVFTTAISNIPAGSSVHVTIKYIQELKHDAEVDGMRLTIPTSISPRYGAYPGPLRGTLTNVNAERISITVDVSMTEGTPIRKVISPTHPIEVTLGSLSTSTDDEDPSVLKASATLSLNTIELDQDFVLQVVAKDIGIPHAILETHPILPNQRALMTTLVPKFNLEAQKPEIIFIADRSGSMHTHIPTLVSALKVFLKSIPIGCTFNICSFGSHYQFLWQKSQLYSEDTLALAIRHIDTFGADFGGTETLAAVRACCEARHKKLPTELMLLTDGNIWAQQELFEYVSTQTNTGDVRVFPIGIGGGVSSALIEGVARAGRGFPQMVADNEKLDGKIVRMLKGALTPHIKDYRLEVRYEDDSIESVSESLRIRLDISGSEKHGKEKQAKFTTTKPISLFDPDHKEEPLESNESKDPFAGLPPLNRPNLLQTPHEIPALFPFIRTCIYLLLAPESSHLKPKSVILKGTAPQGPLELEILIQAREHPDEMIHQLAARKATQELEEGHGWLADATHADTDELVKHTHEAHFALLQRREAVRLGVEFQVGGKYCSFVAVEADEAEVARKRKVALGKILERECEEEEDWEVVSDMSSGEVLRAVQSHAMPSGQLGSALPFGGGGLFGTPNQLPQGAPVPAVNFGRGGGFGRGVRGGVVRGGSPAFARGGRGGAPSPPSFNQNTMASSNTQLPPRGSQLFGSSIPDPGRRVSPFLAPTPFDTSPRQPQSSLFGSSQGSALQSMNNPQASMYPASSLFAGNPYKKQKCSSSSSDTFLHRLIAHQSFSGSFPSAAELPCEEMGIDRVALEDVMRERSIVEQVLCTAVFVVFLERKMRGDEETWELVVQKAKGWLEGNVERGGLVEVFEVVEGLVG